MEPITIRSYLISRIGTSITIWVFGKTLQGMLGAVYEDCFLLTTHRNHERIVPFSAIEGIKVEGYDQ